jgi:predicted outer membrane repeat protein
MAISLPTSATAFPVITRCIISNNVGGTAGGGGVYSTGQNTAAGVTPTLFVNCTFSGNSTGGQGGAVYNISSGQLFVNTLFINNTAAGNGGALSGLLASKASFINCTLFGNTTSTSTSGGIYAIATPPNSSITIYNSILWGNSNIQGKQVSLAKGAGTVSITVSNSIVQDTTVWAGTGNSNGNPLFTDTLANIFTLQCSSPAFNTGDNSLYYGNINADKDLGGDMRLANGVIDMGAYEFSRSGNHTVLPVSICQGDSYTFNGTTYDTSNYTATDTLVNQYGCDSIITLNLTVHPTPAAPVITHNGDNLSATPGYSSYQWLLNGDEIFNALDSTYTATQNGIYSIRVTDSNGCTAVSDTLHITVGIPEVSAQSVLVYPNPAVGGYLHISSSLPVNAAITTIDGKQVMTRNNAQTIDLSNLAAGTYFLKMTDAQGRFIKAERIVVAKQR